MAKSRAYGKTWWGNAWIEALERIDYNTNRLPRGRSYASGGRVKEITIHPGGMVLAKVKGTRPTPYKVEIELKKFSIQEQRAIEEIISEDPALAAELSMGRLPEKVLELLKKLNISLLPEDWGDISATCSCPDWANPCKHLAAVYYLIANEIDKDPLILFKLRGLDDRKLMKAAGFAGRGFDADISAAVEVYSSAPSFIAYQEANLDWKNLGKEKAAIDLSTLAGNKDSESIFRLLNDSQLFYSGKNFKSLLLKAYKNVSTAMERIELQENGFSLKDVAFTLIYPSAGELQKFLLEKRRGRKLWQEFSFFATASGKEMLDALCSLSATVEEKVINIPLAAGGIWDLKKKPGVMLPVEAVFDLFLSLPFKLPADQTSPWADFLSGVTAVAQALAKSSALIPSLRGPDPVENGGKGRGSFYVVYRPLDRSGKLKKVVEYLASLMPPGFVFAQKDKRILEGCTAVEELLTLILTYIVYRYSGIQPEIGDKIARTFFCSEGYHAEKFEEQQTAKAISDWLGWLNLRPVNISPVIKIGLPRPGNKKFTLRVNVENKRDPLSPMLHLSEIFSDCKEVFSIPVELARQEVARQLTIAGDHLPILKKLLSFKGKKLAALSPDALAEFLTRGREICSLLGIRVMIPRELRQMAVPQLALAAEVKKGKGKNVSYFNFDEMLEFSWQVSLGGVTMTGEEFCKLAATAEGVVKFREQYLLLQPEEVKVILDKLRNPAPQLSSMEILRAAVSGDAGDAVFSPGEMLKRLVDDLTAVKEVSLPEGLNAKLRPYQQRGYNWLYQNTVMGLGSCLADDMGLGKTIQVIAVLLKLKQEGLLDRPALVVCPTTLIGNWIKECSKFAPSLKVSVYHGSSRMLATKGVDIIVTSYGILRRDVAKFKRNKWSYMVIDEAQNIKNTESDQTRAVKSVKAKAYIAMSGTPVENRLTELWSIFDFINKGYLGSRQYFNSNFALPIEKYRDREKIAKLKKATAPFLLRRLKNDKAIIKDLPPKVVIEENCYLSPEQAALYQQVVDRMLKDVEQSEGIARKGLVFKLMTALKQICNHPVQYTKKGNAIKEYSGKAEKLLSLLKQIVARGEKALVFTQYKEMGDLLVGMIRGELQVEVLFFHGGVSRQKRDEMVEKFQGDKDSAPIMIVSLKAGGTGLNLTAATNVIHYDLWWNPAVEDQATDRTYRIGQTRTVMVHRLVSLGTFEEKINEMMAAKRELAELTVAVGESWISELSNEELRELFKLES